MATGNGHDPNTTRMVELLEQIEKRLARVEDQAGRANEGIAALAVQMCANNLELRGLREDAQEARDLRDRVAKTEADIVQLKAALKPTGT